MIEECLEPGETATTINRPVLQSLLSRIASGALTVDMVIAHKLNRMACNLDDYVPLRTMLAKHGVRLMYVVEKIDATPSGRLLENIMASIAQFESANLSEETKKGMRQKVLGGGWPHKPPRGYVSIRDSEGQGSRTELHAREAPLLRRAFELYATGHYSVKRLSEILGKEGVISRGGRPLAVSYLRRILANPFYCGRVKWQDLEVPGKHPALVTLDLFATVQRVIEMKYRDSGPKGRLACATASTKMITRSATGLAG